MRRLLPLLTVLLALFGLVRLFRYVQQYDPGSQRFGPGSMPEISIEMKGATVISRTRGQTDWSLHADRIAVKRPDYGGLESYSGISFTAIKNGKLYREGKLAATYSAPSATYDRPTGVFSIDGPIKLVSADGDRLEAETCLWSERADEVRLGKGARALVQGHNLTSPFVLFLPRKRIMNCPQGAEGTFDEWSVRASNLVWDVKEGLVHCQGPVTCERKDAVYSAQSADVQLVDEKGSQGKRTQVATVSLNKGSVEFRKEGE